MKYLKTYNRMINEISVNENQLIKQHLSSDGKSLNIGNLNLTELPELPEGLERLYCTNNQLTKLPKLPKGLERLYCDNNQLTELPELPKGLKYLYCGNNKLTKLPEIPKGLRELYCHDNQLPYDNLEKYWEWFWKENPDLHNAKKMGLY